MRSNANESELRVKSERGINRSVNGASVFLSTLLVLGLLTLGARAEDGFAKHALNSQAVLSDFSKLFLHERADSDEEFVMKLDRPVSYVLLSKVDVDKVFRTQFEEIARSTGVKFNQVRNGKSADIVIGLVFSDDAFARARHRVGKYRGIHRNTTAVFEADRCIWMASFNPRTARIERLAVVYFFKDDLLDGSIDCVHNALWRFTGPLGNDLTAGSDAGVFTKASVSARPSDYEKSLLSLLYDKRIRSGMNRDAALGMAKTILQERKSRQ